MKDANNNDVCGFTISKSSSGTMGTVSYIVNNKVRKTENIDLSNYNKNFGYASKTATYKNRKSFKAWSNTTFKNFRLSEMPDCFMLNFDTTPLQSFLKKDVYGDEKYVNIQGVVE